MFFLFLLLLCTFAFLYMVTRRDVFLFFCIFFFFTFCTQVFLYMVRAKFVPFSSCILVFLYFELTFFFTFVFLYFCTYIDRVTRHKRGLFTSQDVIFPQPRCTQSCSPFSWKYKYIQPFKSNHLDIQRVSYAGHNQCQLWGCILTQPRMSTFSPGFANQMENTALLGNLINWSNLNAKHNSTNLRPIILWPFEGHHCHCCIR